VFDPTSGTGTFLNVFYQVLTYLGKKNHQELLGQIWGNDISHFPAVLSVINLYKQKVDDVANFPRITRKDYFNLQPKQTIQIPDNKDIGKLNNVEIPLFDAIVSNFPFIQQEDIPNDVLTEQFRREFQKGQEAFLEGTEFKVNERSDYYIYCFYNSLKFLKPSGYLSVITSNAWLGKNYGAQFKRFLLDNFSIRYVFRSNAEHWFKNSQVSTVFITLQRGKSNDPTRFVTLNFKLDEKLTGDHGNDLQFIEDFYTQIDNCEQLTGQNWNEDEQYKTVFTEVNDSTRVSVVPHKTLIDSLENQENWSIYFTASNPLAIFGSKLISPHGTVFTNGRGTRTGQDEMHILTQKDVKTLKIEPTFLQPVLQSSRHISTILHDQDPDTFLFICDKSESELQKKYPYAYKWIKKWELERNKKGVLLPKVFENRKPYWYTLKTEQPANIFISINPDKKLFFSYSPESIHLNQRLVAIRARQEDTPIITALLNSIVSLLVVELNGVSRNLGALDLNADFFKTKMKILNPTLLTKKNREEILAKFTPLSTRTIESYDKEFKQRDRIEFDQIVLKSYGYDIAILPKLYALLTETIDNRVDMKNR
jgi:N-6 DNA Methylase